MIIAAGGIGSRMGTTTPKQYLLLSGKMIALYSFELFCQMEEIDEIIVVCESAFRSFFFCSHKLISFADAGIKRQDSIFNGFRKASKIASIVCTHDAARPFVEKEAVLSLLNQTLKIGAATLVAPVICTIKQCKNGLVENTLDRSRLWETQTPQAMRRELFEQGFVNVQSKNLDVTDDTSLAELLNKPVAIVPSSHRNFKITTPIDLAVAQELTDLLRS